MRQKPRLFTRVTLLADDVQRIECAVFASGTLRYRTFLTTDAGGEVYRAEVSKHFERRSRSAVPAYVEGLLCCGYQECGK